MRRLVLLLLLFILFAIGMLFAALAHVLMLDHLAGVCFLKVFGLGKVSFTLAGRRTVRWG